MMNREDIIELIKGLTHQTQSRIDSIILLGHLETEDLYELSELQGQDVMINMDYLWSKASKKYIHLLGDDNGQQ